MDMHSGGDSKEKWEYIYIEAPEDEAKVIFYNRFGHSPERVTCTCCGDDYSIRDGETLAEVSKYKRERGAEIETVEAYSTRESILVIPRKDIKDSERLGDVPRQGYIWCD